MTARYTSIATETRDHTLTIRLNRPAALNAFSAEMGAELRDALEHVQRDPQVRCVVLTGSGRAFCVGQDLRVLRDAPDDAPVDLGAYVRDLVNPVARLLRTLEKPVIAAINGAAAGAGLGFALAADLRLCARSAVLKLAFLDIGLVPDAASSYTLVQHLGYARAAEFCLLGEPLTAEEAGARGLVHRVVDDDALPAATDAWARRLKALPPKALALTKQALQAAWNATLDAQLDREARHQAAAGRTGDHREGLAAFFEKRPPRFTGA